MFKDFSAPLSNKSIAASSWLASGYLPYPILPGLKNPRLKPDDWLENLSEEKLIQHWEVYPADDVALYCSNGLIVLDADTKESMDAIEQLQSTYNLHSNLTARTKKGVHYYYKNRAGLDIRQAGHSTEKHPERIDIRCGKSYIIAPPSTDKELLVPEIVPFDQLVELTPTFVEALQKHNGKGAVPAKVHTPWMSQSEACRAEPTDQKLQAIRLLISHLDPDAGYSDWIKVLMAIHHETNGSDEGLAIADEWSSKGPSYKGLNEVAAKWASFNDSPSPTTMGTVRHMLTAQGLDPNRILQSAFGNINSGGAVVHAGTNQNGVLRPLDARCFPHQPVGNRRNLPPTLENFSYLMKEHGVEIRYNEVTKETVIQIPYLVTSIDNAENVKYSHIHSLCSLNQFPVEPIKSLCTAIADQNRFNPVREWISSRGWDGTDRLEAFYATLVAAEDFPNDFKKILMKRWMISAVAAAFNLDGFQCRGVLTLSGKQGLGKTSWLNSLVSDAQLRKQVVLTGHSLDASNKDSKMTAIQNWIVELGELESTMRKLSLLKAFITNDMDTFRRPYAPVDSTFPRRTVFAASVNDSHFLNDSTGNSRWWSIPVVGVDYQHGLDMQQVFAQVKEQLYDKGEGWWLGPEEEALLTALNKDSEVISPIQEMVMTYLTEAKGAVSKFMTATALLQRVGISSPTRGQIKEVHAVLTEVVGPKRKSNGQLGWDVPLSSASPF